MASIIKYRLLLGICTLIATTAYANKIDSLSTKEDIRKFLTDNFSTHQLTHTSYTPEITAYYKADFDNNGSTDLLVKTDRCIAVLDKGNKRFKLHHIYAGERENYDVIDVLNVNDHSLPVLRGYLYEAHQYDGIIWQDDTLIYKFGDFIEYNAHPPSADVEEIVFKLGGGYPGRVWDLKIDASGWATFEMERGERIFAGEVDSITYNCLIQTINYIDFPALLERESKKKSGPSTLSTSEETYTLEITFKNGETTRTYDYGGIGTYGLKNLYRQLFIVAKSLDELL